ncbi:FkbM family methyltransferase [Blastococcus sp. CT_GayMR20]|uniref:FkbM family methyltransferase n=1 Tax=Blastococcus sp. CT_GayMR20 TaxID=2559609 RepID=UPI0010744C40|nr:FkbM family methyltransferase [Blastococcus sp. CT_GayMR20]TFV85694.1 FkbM family methyltransferase [Blastococcus sp. CT_GayMR20]
MPDDQPFISYAQNAEDVVLWRALRHLSKGRYVEVGANDPTEFSITRAFYDRGWTGIEIEPVAEFAEAFRRERPQDVTVQAAVTDEDVQTVTLHVIDGTGLSTLDAAIAEGHQESGWDAHNEVVPARRLDDVLAEHLQPDDDIHFLIVDVEGSERAVLASVDLRRWRPWVLVVEATAPRSTKPTHHEWEDRVVEAGYEFCLFDGLSRFYVAEEHASELRSALSAPANPFDEFIPYRWHQQGEELRATKAQRDELLDEVIRWRGTVLARWVEAAASGAAGAGPAGHEVVRLRKELEAHRATLSWRVTAPLRAVQQKRMQGWR